ncbi:MAG: tetratricopeptide repeat protein, partial [Saprospiraceae bacterium]|nr:tetratricopeptide repeat protein [Saprospiraceae bacterium]
MLKNKYLLISFVIVFMVSVNFSQAEAQSLSKRANKLLELESYKDALKSFQKIVSDDPENREARIKLAECYLACNYQEDATK